MAKAKSKLNYRRHQLRIPLEYKKKYAEIFLKDLMRIRLGLALMHHLFNDWLSYLWRDGIVILWMKFVIFISKISKKYFLIQTMFEWPGTYSLIHVRCEAFYLSLGWIILLLTVALWFAKKWQRGWNRIYRR